MQLGAQRIAAHIALPQVLQRNRRQLQEGRPRAEAKPCQHNIQLGILVDDQEDCEYRKHGSQQLVFDRQMHERVHKWASRELPCSSASHFTQDVSRTPDTGARTRFCVHHSAPINKCSSANRRMMQEGKYFIWVDYSWLPKGFLGSNHLTRKMSTCCSCVLPVILALASLRLASPSVAVAHMNLVRGVLQLRGGSGMEPRGDLRGTLASLESVLHKTAEISEILSAIENTRASVPETAKQVADAKKIYLKEKVLPLFAMAVRLHFCPVNISLQAPSAQSMSMRV